MTLTMIDVMEVAAFDDEGDAVMAGADVLVDETLIAVEEALKRLVVVDD